MIAPHPSPETSRKTALQTVGIYTPFLNHFIETVAYWISFDRTTQVVLITPNHVQTGEHPSCLKRLTEYAKAIEKTTGKTILKIVDPETQPIAVDHLYLSLTDRRFLFHEKLNRWVKCAKQIGLLSHSSYKNGWKQQLKEFCCVLPYSLSAKSILCQISSQTRHPYFFIRQQAFYAPSVHPQLIVNPEYLQLTFEAATEPIDRRSCRFLFLGNCNPPERAQVLQQVKAKLGEIANPVYSDELLDDQLDNQLDDQLDNPADSETLTPPSRIKVFWREYGDQGKVRGLKPPQYLNALRQADFCICPLGWGGNWTHRVIEAIVCGSIPILEDETRYNIGLTDRQNCIVVKNGDWKTAIERAHQLSFAEVTQIRQNLQHLTHESLQPSKASRRLKASLGL